MSETSQRQLGESDSPIEDELEDAFTRMVDEGSQRLHRSWREVLVTGFFGGTEVAMGVLAYLTVLHQTHDPLLAQMKGCLAAGYPFVFGFLVYESFESDEVTNNGVVPLPDPSEELLGGHAVMAVGYEESSKRFLVRNSWGTDWALGGYCTMPYAYLADPSLSSDIWTVRLIET